MKTIVTEIAENFINRIVSLMTEGEKSFAEIEETALQEGKSCKAAKLMGNHAESVDAEIAADKAGRREWDVRFSESMMNVGSKPLWERYHTGEPITKKRQAGMNI